MGPLASALIGGRQADVLHWQESRRPRTDKQLLNLLLPDDDTAGPSASISLLGPAEPTLRRMLSILAVALAMLGDAHLLAVRRFNERCLSYALAQRQDLSLRGPTLQEILSGDKTIWTTISGLVRDQYWSLTDAMNEAGFCRQDVSALLQPRPKAAAPNPGKRPEPKRSANSDKRARRSACALFWDAARTRNADCSMAAPSLIEMGNPAGKIILQLLIRRLHID